MRSQRAQRTAVTLLAVALTGFLLVWAIGRLPDVTTSRLPGAAGGSHTYRVTAMFSDVLDLVPNSTVQLADVPVGRVTGITVGSDPATGQVARVTMAIDVRYRLPESTTAAIRSTSLLGEKYVALTAPEGAGGSLRAAGVIPLAHTTDDVQVEQLLASLGALLNGGGLQQLSTITREMSTALTGHEDDTRRLLGNLEQIMAQLNQSRGVLLQAIDATSRLSAALSNQDQVLGQSVRDLDPATGVLAREQTQLTSALASLQTLSQKATPLIRRSTDATVTDLRALAPVVTELGKAADLLPEDLTLMVTYPFADNAVPAFSGAYGAIKGTVVVDLPQLLQAVAPVPQSQADGTTPTFGTSSSATTPAPTAKPAPSSSASSPSPSAGASTPPVNLGGVVSGLLGLLSPKGAQ